MKSIRVTYLVRSELSPDAVAERLAREQSARGFRGSVALPAWAIAEIESASVIDHPDFGKVIQVCVSFDSEWAGSSPGQLLNVIAGEIGHLCELDQVRLHAVSLPRDLPWIRRRPSIAEKLDVRTRPCFCGPIVPPLGLSNEDQAHLAEQAWTGGLDIVKDDELAWIASSDLARLHVRSMLEAKMRAEAKSGVRKAFVANLITGGRGVQDRLRLYSEEGVDGVLVSPVVGGLDQLAEIAGSFHGIIIAHNSLLSSVSARDFAGIGIDVWIALIAAAGADVLVTPSPWGPFAITERQLRDIHAAATRDHSTMWLGLTGAKTVLSLADCVDLLGTTAFVFMVGSGVFRHPHSPEAGARALHLAWEAIATQTPLEDIARTHPGLDAAIVDSLARGYYGPKAFGELTADRRQSLATSTTACSPPAGTESFH